MVSSEPVIPREQRPAIANYLSERLAGPVSIEIWTQRESRLVRTDRDPCMFCEPVSTAARQLAALHPLVSLTPYDIDKHADRAAEAGIERPPVTVLRRAQRPRDPLHGALVRPALHGLHGRPGLRRRGRRAD